MISPCKKNVGFPSARLVRQYDLKFWLWWPVYPGQMLGQLSCSFLVPHPIPGPFFEGGIRTTYGRNLIWTLPLWANPAKIHCKWILKKQMEVDNWGLSQTALVGVATKLSACLQMTLWCIRARKYFPCSQSNVDQTWFSSIFFFKSITKVSFSVGVGGKVCIFIDNL